MQTDWRGIIAGFALGLLGTALLVVFPDPVFGWVALALALGLLAFSVSSKLLRKRYAAVAGMVVAGLMLAPINKVADYEDALRPAPRLEFGGLRWDHHDGFYWPVIQLHNTAGVEANNFIMIQATSATKEPTNVDWSVVRASFCKGIPLLAPAIPRAWSPPITAGVDQPLQARISDSVIEDVKSGKSRLSIMYIAAYSHEGRNPKHIRVSTFYGYLSPEATSGNILNSWITYSGFTQYFPATPQTFSATVAKELKLDCK